MISTIKTTHYWLPAPGASQKGGGTRGLTETAMKASCLWRSPIAPPPLFSILHRYSKLNFNNSIFHNQSITPSSFSSYSSSSCVTPQHKLQTPLFLRPPIYSTTLSDLHSFLNWAKTLASSVGSSFEQIDNGPDSSLLLRELKWFLDDTLDDPSQFTHLDIPQNGESCTKLVVNLRANLDQMYKLWKQRIHERRPFQYIVGCEHWRDLVLSVEEGVLIPRPETEKIVDLVGDVMGKCGLLKDGLWADLGTGSGALAIGIARVLGENGRVIATDLSPIAVAVAKYNVERYGLQDFIEVKHGSWFEPLMDMEGGLAGLVSNPPYIPSRDIGRLQAEVGKYEPKLALDGGVEGMDHLIYLIQKTSTMLKPGGFFALETNGEKQCKLLADYLENSFGGSFRDVNVVPDFAGILRFVTGFRQ